MRSLYLKLCFSAVTLALVLIWSPACSAGSSSLYDSDFKYSTERFLSKHYEGRHGWRWLKSQGMAESNLDPRARSHVGAMGVMQFMPATWAEVSQQLGINASPYNARASIIAGGYYQRRMLDFWTSPRPIDDHRRWAWSSYNWGAGNMLKAQKKAHGTPIWFLTRPHLPQETIIYVYRIERYREQLDRE